MPSPLAEAFLMGILNGCYETPSKTIIAIYDFISALYSEGFCVVSLSN